VEIGIFYYWSHVAAHAHSSRMATADKRLFWFDLV